MPPNLKRPRAESVSEGQKHPRVEAIDPQLLTPSIASSLSLTPGATLTNMTVPTEESDKQSAPTLPGTPMPPRTPILGRYKHVQPAKTYSPNPGKSPLHRNSKKMLKKGTSKTKDVDHFFARYIEASHRPHAECKRCRSLCDENKLPDDSRTWVYGNSSTTTLRKHLETYHPDEYLEACTMHGWPIAIESLCKSHQIQQHSIEASKMAREEVTVEGLL
ncbi:hypothetical protein BS47DRAFT_281570 [Hydnum rufescens UP504]|uniref:Uncharacterized protein n=1 Tax=Hydnum rufescens UP504 TaxID=1448309 RepID=A0A9P6AMS5_9AGAM|nr:hypothetical protein BS47DRAFT_281570 [Hydnum rufescens UP504]